MSTASPKTQELARRLHVSQAAQDNSSDPRADFSVEVVEELRKYLSKLVGVDGFRALLSRALSIAKAEVPSLNVVEVRPDGSLEGLDGIEQSHDAGKPGHAGIILVAHLLKLLMTFIGEALTLRLLRDKWPDASMDGVDLVSEE